MASGTLTCATGVFTLTLGTSTSFAYTDRTLVAAKGEFVETGQAAALKTGRVLTAGTGSFALTGQNAILSYSRYKRLEAGTGAFVFTLGTSTSLPYTDRTVVAAKGTFALTGNPATLTYGRTLACVTGAFILSGAPAVSRRSELHSPGAFVLTGRDAVLTYSGGSSTHYALTADPGAFTFNFGTSTSQLFTDHRLIAQKGTFVLAGQAADLKTPDHRLIAAAGFFSGTYHAAILTKAGGTRSLPAYVLGHANDPAQVVEYLVEILYSTPWRWTTFGRPLYALSHVWTNYAVQVSGLSAGLYDAASCNIVVGDGSDVVAAADLATAKGLTGTLVNVYEAWLDPDTFALQATVQKFRGKVSAVSLDLASASLACGPWVSFAGKDVPRWTATTICPYAYKDGRCGYAGGLPTCLKTYADCTAHSNTARFGGFRNLPKPGLKILWSGGAWSLKEPAP